MHVNMRCMGMNHANKGSEVKTSPFVVQEGAHLRPILEHFREIVEPLFVPYCHSTVSPKNIIIILEALESMHVVLFNKFIIERHLTMDND